MKAAWRTMATAAALAVACGAPAATAAEVRFRGLLDLCATVGNGEVLNQTSFGDSPFDPYRLRLFVDASLAPGVQVFAQTVLHEGQADIRADAAYLMWTPWEGRDAHLEAGKIPWPVGTWGPRTYSDRNPLIGAPLMYQYHAALPWNTVPDDVDELVSHAGQGQELLGEGEWVGMPVVDDRWWDVGVAAIGSHRPFEYALGVVRGSPGWPEPGAEDVPGQTVLGRLGAEPFAGLRAGVSAAWGTWAPEWFAYAIPSGGAPEDYKEWLAMADLELMRDRWEVRAEAFVKEWETVTTGNLRFHGGYAEARLGVGAGAWLAARAELMRFGDVTTSAGITRPWDDGVDRYEAGLGYRVTRDVQLRLVAQRNVQHPFGSPVRTQDLGALAASIRF
jgi:hypothetical protein